MHVIRVVLNLLFDFRDPFLGRPNITNKRVKPPIILLIRRVHPSQDLSEIQIPISINLYLLPFFHTLLPEPRLPMLIRGALFLTMHILRHFHFLFTNPLNLSHYYMF